MPSIKESVTLHIGQAGIQVGHRTWELFTEEHGINPDGTRGGDSFAQLDLDPDDDSYLSFFHETSGGQHVPRSVFVDTEPSAMDSLRGGKYGRLFHPDAMLSYKQDCKSNFFEGRTMAAAYKIQEEVMDRVRLTVELCQNLQGFFVFHSFGGGTGSGVGVEVLHELRHQFAKKVIFQPAIFPSTDYSSSIVEPYNCIFTMHYTRKVVDLSFMLDNQAVYRICGQNLKIKNPHFRHVNKLIAQCISGVTSPLRYETELNSTLLEIHQNLVPSEEFRYPLISLAPVRNEHMGGHEQFQTPEIVAELFEEKNFLCDVTKLHFNRYLAAVVILRGDASDDVGSMTKKDFGMTGGGGSTTLGPKKAKVPIQVNAVMAALNTLRNPPPQKTHTRAVKFVPWMEGSGFKVGIVSAMPAKPRDDDTDFPLAETSRQGILIGNNTAVRQLFVRQYAKFLKLYFHKAFMWQFIDANGEPDAFEEARESVRDIIDDYEKLLGSCAEAERDRHRQGSASTMPRLVGATERGGAR